MVKRKKNRNNKGKRRRKTGLTAYLNPHNLTKEIRRYGYKFSFKNVVFSLGAVILVFLCMAYIYKLNYFSTVFIISILMVVVPQLILIHYRNMFYIKEFEDVNNYMEQMMYSFKRRGKILSALNDTLTVFEEGKMHDVIRNAIGFIQYGEAKSDIYREALAIIEEEYGCKRLFTMHSFLVNIEESGGKYDESLDILLKDRKLWVERVYEFQKDKKNVGVKVLIGIIISMVIGAVAVRIMPESIDVSKNIISQAVTTVIFVLNIIIYFQSNKMLCKRMLDGEVSEKDSYQAKKDYRRVFLLDKGKRKGFNKIASVAIGLLGVAAAFPVYYYDRDLELSLIIGASSLVMAYLFGTNDSRKLKYAKKRLAREIEKVFPDWLLAMSLLLQTNNVHVSISRSIESAPEAMKEELRKLEGEIASDPNSIKPYLDFYKELNLADVQSSMKQLYSMAEFGTHDVTTQINTLVERNAVLIDRSERYINEDRLSCMGIFVILPMLTGGLKIMVDMALIIYTIVGLVNAF